MRKKSIPHKTVATTEQGTGIEHTNGTESRNKNTDLWFIDLCKDAKSSNRANDGLFHKGQELHVVWRFFLSEPGFNPKNLS